MWLISLTSTRRAQVYYLSNIMEGNPIWSIKWLGAPYQPDHKTTAMQCNELEAEEGRVNPPKKIAAGKRNSSLRLQGTATPPIQHIWAVLLYRNKDFCYFKRYRLQKSLHSCCIYWVPDLSLAALKACWTLPPWWSGGIGAVSKEILRDTTIRKMWHKQYFIYKDSVYTLHLSKVQNLGKEFHYETWKGATWAPL